MRKTLYKSYFTVQGIIAPGLENSQFAYKNAISFYLNCDTRWLDLGCGHQLLPEWMPSARKEQAALVRRAKILVGIDVDTPSLRRNKVCRNLVGGNIELLPFANETFDVVTANMVVEHVRDPDALLAEVNRVLRPKGIFLFHTPNLWGYTTLAACMLPRFAKTWLSQFLQNRSEEDVFPTYYRMNTPRAVQRVARRHSFAVLKLDLMESSAQTIMLGPVVVLELLLIRALRLRLFRKFRTNTIAILQKLASRHGEEYAPAATVQS